MDYVIALRLYRQGLGTGRFGGITTRQGDKTVNALGWILLALLAFAAFIWIVRQWKIEEFYNGCDQKGETLSRQTDDPPPQTSPLREPRM
jgi:hypothetical protein